MLYSKQKNFLFCRVSRTGGVSTGELLKTLIPDLEPILPQHASMRDAKQLLGQDFDHVLRYAMVRNPWERLVSWYGLLVQSTGETPLNRSENDGDGDKYQFQQFLQQWYESKQLSQLSQWQQLTDEKGELAVNHLGRFESLSEDVTQLLQKLDLQPMQLPRFNGSWHHHYSHYYNDSAKDLVAKYFAQDIDKFNYQFEQQS